MPSPPKQLTKNRKASMEDIRDLVQEWADGTPWDEVDADLVDLLRDGHREASRLGRQHGGDTAANDAYDLAAAALAWDGDEGQGITGEGAYWLGLVEDVTGGRYGVPGDEKNPARVDSLAHRVGLYNRAWIATANDAWVDTEPPETLYEWIQTAQESCGDCARWAKGGPYLVEDLPSIPGSGESECRVGCACYLKSDDGTEGFGLE